MNTILYKMDSLYRILYWKISIEYTTITVEWGIMNPTTNGPAINQSSLQSTVETHPTQEKAQQVFESAIREKISRKGYSTHIPKSVPALPMLATDWDGNAEFKSFATQPKLDGYRCIGSAKELRSRLNSIIPSVPHINAALQGLPEGVKLDGELYIHGADLQTISGYVKRNSPHVLHRLIEYHIFDIVMLDTPYEQRYEELRRVYNHLETSWSKNFAESRAVVTTAQINNNLANFPIKFVDTRFCLGSVKYNMEQITLHHSIATRNGYEGIIIRDCDGLYELNKRSKALVKYKEFLDDEFQIVNIEQGKNGAVLVVRTGNTTTNVALGFTNLRKQAVWEKRERYIGWWAKVKFQKILPTGRLFQPTCIDMYQSKEDAK